MTIVAVEMDVRGASADNAAFIYGPPSSFAAIGFVGCACRRAGFEQKPDTGVNIILHDYALRGIGHERGRTREASHNGVVSFDQIRSADRDVKGQTQLDIPRCDLAVTLIFEVDETTGDRPLDATMTHAVDTMRFASGRIDKFKVSVTAQSVSDAIQRPGFMMIEPLISDTTGADLSADPVERLIQLSTPRAGRKHWYTPSLMGFRLLEEPRLRGGVRQNLRHAYCDPLLWLVQWVSAHRVKGDPTLHAWRAVRRANTVRFTTAKE